MTEESQPIFPDSWKKAVIRPIFSANVRENQSASQKIYTTKSPKNTKKPTKNHQKHPTTHKKHQKSPKTPKHPQKITKNHQNTHKKSPKITQKSSKIFQVFFSPEISELPGLSRLRVEIPEPNIMAWRRTFVGLVPLGNPKNMWKSISWRMIQFSGEFPHIYVIELAYQKVSGGFQLVMGVALVVIHLWRGFSQEPSSELGVPPMTSWNTVENHWFL